MIGILGGTFDPIHFGHLHIAKAVMEVKGLSGVVFVPAQQNPLKPRQCSASGKDRLAMVHLAVDRGAGWKVDDREQRREGPSYTFTTVSEIVKENPKEKFILIIGEDSAQSFHRWHRSRDIVDLVDLAVVQRPGVDIEGYEGDDKVVAALEKGKVEISEMDISSTEVRERLFRGQNCDQFVPRKVLDYIKVNGLYLKS